MIDLRRLIAEEREVLSLAPWQFAPAEVDDGPNPWGRAPCSAGFTAWNEAADLRRRLLAEDPTRYG